MPYQKIVVAVDLGEESQQVLDHAQRLSIKDISKLRLVHVLEPLIFAYGTDASINFSEIQEQLEIQAREKITALAQKNSIALEHCHILIGGAADEIHKFADDEAADIIVVGSHGRSGLSLLLGSTANAVLHGAKRDVLAVRVAI